MENPIQSSEEASALESPPEPTPVSLSPQLPPELIIHILESFEPPRPRPVYFGHRTYPQQVLQVYNVIEDNGQAQLVRAALVCREWHAMADGLLYVRPLLRTRVNVHLFARTLKDNSSLAPLVRTLFLLETSSEFDDFSPTDTYLLAILKSCPLLKTLTWVNCPHYRSVLHTSMYPTIANQLQNLIIQGYSSDTQELSITLPPADLSLLHLRVLSLGRIVFVRGYPFPHMPSLRTLQLVRCSGDIRQVIEIPSASFPCLETLELCQNSARIVSDERLLSNLVCLHHIAPPALPRLPIWCSLNDMPTLKSLRSLAFGSFGVIGADENPSISILQRLPPRLETITIYVRPTIKGLIGEPWAMIESVLSCLHRLLVSNRDLGPLREVVLMMSVKKAVSDGELTEADRSAEHIQAACLRRGISFSYLNKPGEADNWMTNRLLVQSLHWST